MAANGKRKGNQGKGGGQAGPGAGDPPSGKAPDDLAELNEAAEGEEDIIEETLVQRPDPELLAASRREGARLPSKPVATRGKPVKPAEPKPAEARPADTKAEAKPVETKPVETKPVETKPVETKPVETKAEEKPVETKAEEKPVETKPVETKPAETKPAKAKPVEAEPVEDEPVAEAKPVETKPAARPAEARPAAPKPKGAAWANPIARFEERWTWFESRLITLVLLSQLAAMVAWVFLNGLSESVGQIAGVVFRAVIGGTLFGCVAWFGARKLDEGRRRTLTLVALALGLTLAPAWRDAVLAAKVPGASATALRFAALDHAMVVYFDNIKGWLQQGSTLTLIGGLRGLATRLTLWLALLGGSLATAAGKHIHIDVIFRFLPKKLRVPSAIVNYLGAAAVCLAGTWGFIDHIAITSYGSRGDDSAGAKVKNSLHAVSDHLFFARKQLGLDLHTLPRVLGGARYDQWMTGTTWNEWVDGAGFEDRFTKEEVQTIRVPDDTPTHVPLIVSPGGETMSGALAHTLSLVFPFGLFAIGLRFLLRAILTLSGHLSADPDEAHKEEIRGADSHTAEGGV